MVNKIKVLPTHLVNQIAAGEVVERPYSIIKELIENSIDAESSSIEVKIKNGGKTFISVFDNGSGISKEDLLLCLKPHTTSKLNENNLNNIITLGFRGEALASIASVSRIVIKSKESNSQIGYQISSNGGTEEQISPSNIHKGTLIQVSDLFYSIPARLNFLKTDGVESTYCHKIFKQLAIANPNINMKFENNDKIIFNYLSKGNSLVEKTKNRVSQILGSSFIENSIYVEEFNPMLKVYGFIGIPTYAKNHQDEQYLIVNGRAIKDKTLSGIIKFAYSDVLFSGKQPCYCLFIDINPLEIDVNVSPTKSEVRFKDINFVRHLLLNCIKTNLGLKETQKTDNTLGKKLLEIKGLAPSRSAKTISLPIFNPQNYNNDNNSFSSLTIKEPDYFENIENNNNINNINNLTNIEKEEAKEDFPLGVAKAQFHKNWILAQNKDGLILVDQHAAHERITQEIIKNQYFAKKIPQQLLLKNDLIQLTFEQMEVLTTYKEQIESLGISVDIFGKDTILIKGIPSILKNPNPKELVIDVIEDFKEIERPENFNKKINDIISTIACHSSIRSGRIMNVTEMNDLLRTMENTPNYAQCSHGRPTFVKISLKDIEKLFSRT